MSGSVNKVILVGNLGNDPDVRTIPTGANVANVSIATNESWTDKQTGSKQERTEWHRVAFWGGLANIAQQYLRKGSLVYIEGRLQTRKWQDQNGVDHYITEIVARDLQMLGGRHENSQANYGAPANTGNYGAPANPAYNNAAPMGQAPMGQAPMGQAPMGQPEPTPPPVSKDYDEDIPF